MTLRSMSENFVLPENVDPEFPFWCIEEEDGSLTIHWDQSHPITSVFNDWTERQFVTMLTSGADKAIQRYSQSVNLCQDQ